MNNYDISVLVLTYNPDWDSLKGTLKSVLGQKDCQFELVISDDGSKQDFTTALKNFFEENSYNDYTLIKNKENIGTVKNLRKALDYCKADYIRDIGQGDILYDSHSLCTMLEYLRSGNYEFICGNVVPMVKSQECIKVLSHCTIQCTSYNRNRDLGRECFIKNEYPHGAAFLYKKDIYQRYLDEISNRVVYCDDLAARLMILDGLRVGYLSEYAVFYECESGISNTDMGSSRLESDIVNFENYLLERPASGVAKKYKQVRKIIALRNKKRHSSGKDKLFITLLLFFSDARIPLNWIHNRCCRKKQKNLSTAGIEKWFGQKCIIE